MKVRPQRDTSGSLTYTHTVHTLRLIQHTHRHTLALLQHTHMNLSTASAVYVPYGILARAHCASQKHTSPRWAGRHGKAHSVLTGLGAAVGPWSSPGRGLCTERKGLGVGGALNEGGDAQRGRGWGGGYGDGRIRKATFRYFCALRWCHVSWILDCCVFFAVHIQF